MSLSDAILDIATAMVEEAERGCTCGAPILCSFARELRTAVKAAGPTPPTSRAATDLRDAAVVIATERAKEKEVRIANELSVEVRRQESGSRMVEVITSQDESFMVPAPNNIPVGAKTNFDNPKGPVYEYRSDGKFHRLEKKENGGA